MPWTTPETYTAGQTLTAASMNAISENLRTVAPYGVGAWTAFTPTWSNLTVGNGTQTCAYMNIGRLYVVRVKLVFGSTSAAGGASPEMTLPNSVSMSSAYSPLSVLGSAVYEDASPAGATLGYVSPGASSNTVARFLLWRADGTFPTVDTVVTSRPFAWTTNDTIHGQFMFEAAS